LIHYIENKAKDFFEKTSLLWSNKQLIFNQLKVSNKFNYGKHGSDELSKLFKNIGIDDIFEVILIQRDKQTMSGVIKEKIDFKGIFDSITKFRNIITHDDATPDLTIQIIQNDYLFLLKEFTKLIAEFLFNEINVLKQK